MERSQLRNLKRRLPLTLIALHSVAIHCNIGKTSGGFIPSNVFSHTRRRRSSTSGTHETASSRIIAREAINSSTSTSNIDIFHDLSSTPIKAKTSTRTSKDNRPHEQRVKQQRKARRLNHSFMHLYRHDSPKFDDQKIAPSSKSFTCAKMYLMEYGHLEEAEVMDMAKYFPPLFDLDVKRHLCPKMRFLKYTLSYHNGLRVGSDVNVDVDVDVDAGTTKGHQNSKRIAAAAVSIPPQYFGSRLEKVIAPRHAFLMAEGLPHGNILLENDAALFKEFLISCRRLKSFTALCNQWRKIYGRIYVDDTFDELLKEAGNGYYGESSMSPITSTEVDAFDSLFTR